MVLVGQAREGKPRDFQYITGSGRLNVMTSVPEPSAYLLGGLGIFLGLRRRRSTRGNTAGM